MVFIPGERLRNMGFPPIDDEVMALFWNIAISMAEAGIFKIFIESKIFYAIPSDGKFISVSELASKCNAEVDLLQRFINFLVADGILSSASGDIAHTNRSSLFSLGLHKTFDF